MDTPPAQTTSVAKFVNIIERNELWNGSISFLSEFDSFVQVTFIIFNDYYY